MITIICSPLRFYSQEDESLFFDWLSKIKSVESFKGIGRELHLYIPSKEMSFNDLQNLRGIFERYKLKKKDQLNIFVEM